MTRTASAFRLRIAGAGTTIVFPLAEGETLIGRAEPADLVLADPQVSSRHAIIIVSGRDIEIRDLESTNGTRVVGQPITRAVLGHGQVINIGAASLTVDDTSITNAAAGPTPATIPVAIRPSSGVGLSLAVSAVILTALVGIAWMIFQRGSKDAGKSISSSSSKVDPTALRARLDRIVKADRPGHRAETIAYLTALEESVAGTLLADEVRLERERLARLPDVAPPDETPPIIEAPTLPRATAKTTEFAIRFDLALQNGRWLDAAAALAELGSPDEAKTRLEKALDDASRSLVEDYPNMVRQWGEEKAYDWFKSRAGELPATSAAAGKLQLKLLELKDPAAARRASGTPEPPSIPVNAPPSNDAGAGSMMSRLEDADASLKFGDIAAALYLLRPLESDAHAAKRADVAERVARLTRRAEGEQRAREMIRRAASDPTIAPKEVPHLPGEKGALIAADGEGVRIGGPKGAVTLKWTALPPHTWAALAKCASEVDDSIDMAVVLLRVAKDAEAHALLAKAVKKQGSCLARVQQTLADGRGIEVPEKGFTLVGERWLSPQENERIALNETLKKDADLLIRGKPDERRAAFEKLNGLGDSARGTLVRALIMRIALCNEELQKDGGWKSLVALKASRLELDRLRKDALTLIDDEKEYPYPYQPPEAAPEAYGKYIASQKLIDERVGLIKKVWEKKDSVKLSPEWKRRVADLMETRAWVDESKAMELADEEPFVMWPPADGVFTIRSIAMTADDRAMLDGSLAAIAWSEANPGRSNKGEQDEFRITNEYRLMMGRHAVRMHDRLTAAARGHTEDMARLGFFAHESPVEGKRTPGQRIRAAGIKPLGASENIAKAGGPSGAHNGWTHSSGHHRNLLSPEWRYLGVGNSGNLWCQNFIIGEAKSGDPDDG